MTADRFGGEHIAAHPRAGDLLIQFADQLVISGRVLSGRVGLVVLLLGLGAQFDPHALFVVGLVSLDDRLVFEVPAFPALRRPQHPVALRTRWADRGQGVPARDEYGFGLSGL